MNEPNMQARPPAPPAAFAWSRFSGRRGLLMLAALALAGGMALNWSWLVAAGIAPILIAVLPCLVMCGLGLCMNRMAGRSCESQPAPGGASDVKAIAAGPQENRTSLLAPAAGDGSVPQVPRENA